MPHALIVDDDLDALAGLAELVGRQGFTTDAASSLGEARDKMSGRRPDVVLLDLVLPDGNGMDLFQDIESRSTTEVVLITGRASLETAVEALRLGAADYLTKPVNLKHLKNVLSRVVARPADLKAEIDELRGDLRSLGRFGRLIGVSRAMQKVYDQIARVAPTAATVLITGESGTGKELVADTVHGLSRRRKEAFLPINCGAIQAQLIESELFGHEKGSFTGATREHRGYFEQADGGTLFLDEITEMPSELQVKLLRVLETGTFMRVGADKQIETDVRLIAATNRNPEEAVAEGKLREDLLYRLQVFPLQMPPLRERGDDIELLANYFLGEMNRMESTHKTFSPEALEQLSRYPWPGNIRELKNAIHRTFIMADDVIDVHSLPQDLGAPCAASGKSLNVHVGKSLKEAEKSLILATLQHCGGSKQETARMLAISLKTLYNRLKDYGVE
ncbi:MAG: sigma-54-dependent transcriptional regulator [Gammaproteobacteria bacterium]